MQKPYTHKKLVLCFLCLVFLSLTACSNPFSTESSATPTPHVQKQVSADLDSCSLVTATQIEQIIKAPITVQEPDKINGHIDLNLCNYNLQSEGGVGVNLNIYQNAMSAKSHFVQLLANDSAKAPVSINDLGDQAYVDQKPFSIVNVLKDNAIIFIAIATTVEDATRRNEEIQIARIAVQNL